MHASTNPKATSPPCVGVCFRNRRTIASRGSVNRSVANCLDIIFGIPRRCPLSPLISSISESLRVVCSLDVVPHHLVNPPKKLASCVKLSVSIHAIRSEPWQAGKNRKSAATVRLVKKMTEIRRGQKRLHQASFNRTNGTQRTDSSHRSHLSCAEFVVDRLTTRCQPTPNNEVSPKAIS